MEKKRMRLWSILLILLLVSSELFFVFSLKPASAEENTALQFGQTVTGAISSLGEKDNYTFSGVVGDVIYVKLQETSGYYNFNPSLQWCAPNGTLLYSRSDYAGFDLYETLLVSGQYTLMVYDDNGYETGSYSLLVQRMNSPQNTTAVEFGKLTSGSISVPGKTDCYTFLWGRLEMLFMLSFRRLLVTIISTVLFSWCAPNGTLLYSRSDYAGFDLYETLLVSGQYTLMVYDDNGYETGSYSLLVQRMNSPQNTTAVEFGKAYFWSISVPGKTDCLLFLGSVGDVIYVKLQETAGTIISIRLFSWCAPNGTYSIAGADYAGFDLYETLLVSGQYTLMVYDDNGYETGSL